MDLEVERDGALAVQVERVHCLHPSCLDNWGDLYPPTACSVKKFSAGVLVREASHGKLSPEGDADSYFD